MKKRGFSLLLAILILTVQIPFAVAVSASGKCGDNLTWTLDDSGTLTISGTGAMNNYNPAPWSSYEDDIRTVLISNGVTTIGTFAFSWCSNLTNITIPNSVTAIEKVAFNECVNLKNITLPNGVTAIGESAFNNCENLINVTIPNSVTTIGESAFSGCKNLTNITLSNSVTSIGRLAFNNCENLTTITIPSSVTTIGEWSFSHCHSLTNITIPNSVTTIGERAFNSCYSLATITISNGVNSIERAAFYWCSALKSIVIPDSVTIIGDGAFFSTSLKNVYYGGNQSQWKSIYIGDDNDYLTNATIHYSVTEPDSDPVTPTPAPVTPTPVVPEPVTPAPQTNAEISKYSYAFANSGAAFGYPAAYKIPVERFQLIYGNTLGKTIANSVFDGRYWSGNCYGMATTAAMLSRGTSKVRLSAFRNGAARPGELQVSDANAEWGLTLKEFIEAMQISQYSATFAVISNQNISNQGQNRLSSLLNAMSSFEEGDRGPLVVCVHGFDKNGVYSGHALLAYRLDGQSLYVYDCNHPNDGDRYITISGGNWSYAFSNEVAWSNSNGGAITYVPYDTYLSDWENRGSVLGSQTYISQTMFFINAADATISDSYGNEMAVFQRGKMIRGVEDAYPIPKLGVTADGSSIGAPQIAVWLPYNNEYKVTSWENATVSAVNVSKGVSVNSVAGGQTVSVSLSSSAQPQFNDVTPDQYFYEPVQWAVRRGITNGITSTTFSPQRTCSRNHILTFLWRANGSPTATIANPFSDVDTSGDFGRAAVWAAEKGLVSGVRFNGEIPCTRAEAVTYLWRLAGRPSAGRSAFTDVPPNADYAQAVSWAVERGITKGTSDTTFEPSKICTRGQIVTFLHRAYVEN